MTLNLQVVKGVKWTSISTAGRTLIQLIQLSLVAHYLSAEALGLFALVQIFLSFSQLFMDMGIGNAVIHQQKNSHRHLSELFTISVMIGLTITFSVYFIAPLLGLFFDEPRLAKYVELVAVVFVIFSLSRIHLALLQKKLAFSIIAKVELLSAITGFIIVISCIVNSLGIEALLYGYIAAASVQSLLFFSLSDFRPSLCYPESWSEIKEYLSFGFYQTGDSIVNFFNSQIDLILVGKLLGTEALGGYSLIRQLCFRPAMVINPVLTRVAFPVMAKLQCSPELPKVYCKLVGVLGILNFPLYVVIFVLATPIISTLFGDQWLHIVSVLQFMAVWCLVRSVMNPVGSLLMAVGKVKLALRWNSFLLIIMPLVIYLSTKYGVFGVAITLAIMQVLLLPGHWYFLLKQSVGIQYKEILAVLIKPLFSAVLAGVVVWLFISELSFFSFLHQLIIGVIIGAVSYIFFALQLCPMFRELLKGHFSIESK